MKIFLLGCVLALSLQGTCASVNSFDPYSSSHNKNPRKERQLYEKGKGTIGWIAGLALGPVGYAGAHLFTRNKTIRDNAGKGFSIWIGVVLLTGAVIGAVESKETGGQILAQIAEGIIENLNFSTSDDKAGRLLQHKSAAGVRLGK